MASLAFDKGRLSSNAVRLANSHTERRSDSASTHPKKQDSLSMTVGTESKCILNLTTLRLSSRFLKSKKHSEGFSAGSEKYFRIELFKR